MINIIGKGGLAREVGGYIAHRFKGVRIPLEFAEHEEIDNFKDKSKVIIAIGDGNVRKKIYEKYKNKFNFGILNYASSYPNQREINKIGQGCILCPGTILTTNIVLGDFVLINLNCTVGHDSKIGPFTTLSPGANISGNVTIGEGCYIGTNAVIREGINICDNVTIGAGGVVVKDIIEPGVYVGNPVKRIK